MARRFTVGSLFSGIGGFDLGLERAGWQVKWQVEKHPFRQRILKRHWPHVELRNDIETDTHDLPRVDLICGGFPCQDLSVAGRRAGLAGEKSGLWHEFIRVVGEIRPAWVFIENVPGLLSSNEGKDMEVVVGGLAKRGYGVAWRVLDSRYFGVAQRRRRVFIVGCLGKPCPPEILFEPEGGGWDTAAVEEAGADVAGTLGVGTAGRGWADDLDRAGAFIPEWSLPLHGRGGRNNDTSKESYIARPLVSGGNDKSDETREPYIAFALRAGRRTADSNGVLSNVVVSPPLLGSGAGTERTARAGSEADYCVVCSSPDPDRMREVAGVPGRVDATPDGPRYAALGDAVTVPVIEWIGRRILAVATSPQDVN